MEASVSSLMLELAGGQEVKVRDVANETQLPHEHDNAAGCGFRIGSATAAAALSTARTARMALARFAHPNNATGAIERDWPSPRRAGVNHSFIRTPSHTQWTP